MQKPHNVTTHEWLARVCEVNNCFPCFPPSTVPPQPASKLDEDQIKDVAKCGIPCDWTTQLHLQNFNVGKKTINEFINFCKRFEGIEMIEGGTGTSNTNNKQTLKNTKKRGHHSDKDSDDPKSKNDGSDFHCVLHGKNATHDAEDCDTLKNFAKKQKQDKI